jgi:hypothetical protein
MKGTPTLTAVAAPRTPDAPVLILKRIAEISHPLGSVDWILDPGQSPQARDIEANFGQLIFEALRPLIWDEMDAAFRRIGSTAATKKASRRRTR